MAQSSPEYNKEQAQIQIQIQGGWPNVRLLSSTAVGVCGIKVDSPKNLQKNPP